MNDLFHDLERLNLSRLDHPLLPFVSHAGAAHDLTPIYHIRLKTADDLFQNENYTAANEEYLKLAREILGPTAEFPVCSNGGIVSQKYASLADADVVDLMGCLNGLAQCERELENMPVVRLALSYVEFARTSVSSKELLWLEESQIVYWTLRFSRAPRLYGMCNTFNSDDILLITFFDIDWEEWFPENVQFSVQYAKARAAAAAAFLSFGNTGTAVHRRYTATLMIPRDHQRREPAISRTILHRGGTQTLTTLRHPDPMMVHRHKITQPSLQLLGSWKKLKINKGSSAGPGRRMSVSTFIWDGMRRFALVE